MLLAEITERLAKFIFGKQEVCEWEVAPEEIRGMYRALAREALEVVFDVPEGLRVEPSGFVPPVDKEWFFGKYPEYREICLQHCLETAV